jgi:cysteinyl-tRNA synthetase
MNTLQKAPVLHLYNSPARKKERFETLEPGKVRMYCCGPTVYNYAHIGNLRTYLFEDFLRRTLEYLGYQVEHVVNITDVGHLTSDADTGEDKLEKGALREGASVWDIAKRYTQEFQKDWKRLNLVEPTHWPRATDYIEQQIALVQTLEKKGYTYIIQDGVYFNTSKFSRYADFAGLDVDNLEAGIRVAMADGKLNSTDFALWKFSPKDSQRAMEWDSPWGKGFPGWHVECSAMAMDLLGPQLDIHCGGIDHLRIHHTNEIAQSECATGKQYSRFWLHGGWLLEDSGGKEGAGKMSKSGDNFVRLETLIQEGYDPLEYRYFTMSSHYKNYLNFSWENLSSAKRGLSALKSKTAPLVKQATSIQSDLGKEWLSKFQKAICDDLNLPQALAVLNTMLKDEDLLPGEQGALVLDFDTILGLKLGEVEEKKEIALEAELSGLVEERNLARKSKDFARADEIRDIFREKGLVLKDTPEGTHWEPI